MAVQALEVPVVRNDDPQSAFRPAEPKMWAKDHVHADQVLLAVEVVSASSVTDDHEVKPRQYAV